MEKEKLMEIKDLLVVVDMVNGFIKEGLLADPGISRIIPRIKDLVERYTDDEDKKVLFFRDSHPDDAVEFRTYPPHCIEGTLETEIVDELKTFADDNLVYFKNSTNGMFARGFIPDLVKMENLESVIVTGCLSEVCVKQFAVSLRKYFDEYNIDIPVYVDPTGIDTYNSEGHLADVVTEMALKDMEENGVKILKKEV